MCDNRVVPGFGSKPIATWGQENFQEWLEEAKKEETTLICRVK